MAETIKIGGELESVATGGIVAAASAIKDKTKNKTQEQVNAETDETLAAHSSAISGFEGGNFRTLVATDADADIAAVFTRLSVTPAVNTIYRIANWKHNATTKYNTAYYSEYAANGTTTADLVPVSLENKGIDDIPTAGSDNLVKSSGLYNGLLQSGMAYFTSNTLPVFTESYTVSKIKTITVTLPEGKRCCRRPDSPPRGSGRCPHRFPPRA